MRSPVTELLADLDHCLRGLGLRWYLFGAQAAILAVDCNNPGAFANCCNGAYPDTVQERAWSSPVFYRPEAAGRVRAKINFGKNPGEDVLKLRLRAQSFTDGPSWNDRPATRHRIG